MVFINTQCLLCDADIIPEITWHTLVRLSPPRLLCADCEGDLLILEGKRCEKCSRLTAKNLCTDCHIWANHANRKDPLEWNHSIFMYNEAIQTMINRWKFRGDYLLGKAFCYYYKQGFTEISSYLPEHTIIIPIPMSQKSLQERGFNQAHMLAEFLPLQISNSLTQTYQNKQSQKNRRQRLESINPFHIVKPINKPVLLTDDIYTTGTTLRHAANILKDQGCPSVYALTLIRS